MESMMEAMASKYLSKAQNNEDEVQANEQDIAHAVHAHEKVYNNDNNEEPSSRDLGSAAALKGFQSFAAKGGGSSSDLMQMVMSELGPLLSAQGGSANHGEAIETAGKMAMQFFMTHNSSGGGGGLGSIMGLLGGSGGNSSMAASLLSKLM